jgi:hypothetical protein
MHLRHRTRRLVATIAIASLAALNLPAAPAGADVLAAPDLTAATDLGASSTDNLTRSQTPQFTVALASSTSIAAGDCVRLIRSTVTTVPDPTDENPSQTKEVASDFEIIGAAVRTSTATILNVTDANAGRLASRVPEGRYLYGFDVLQVGWTPAPHNGLCSVSTVNGVLSAPTGTVKHTSGVLGTTEAPVIIDVTVEAPVPDLLAASDTGPSDSDNITNPADAKVGDGLQISLKHPEAGTTVELYRTGNLLFSGVAPATPVKDLKAAATFPTETGQYGYTANWVDLAGNTATSVLTVTLDFDNPVAPPRIDLIASDDTGTASDDDVTNVVRPTFMVTGVEEGALVELYACESAGCLIFPAVTSGWTAGYRFTRTHLNPTSVAAGTAPHSPSAIGRRIGPGLITADAQWWLKTLPGQVDNYAAGGGPAVPAKGLTANPAWRFSVRQVDLSGRTTLGLTAIAALGQQQVTSVDLNVVIDTVPEPVPAAPTLTDDSQTGPGAGPNQTSTIDPTFNVSRGTGRVELLRDGVVVGSSSGAGDITDNGPLPNGVYTYTTRSVDRAGNISAQSEPTILNVANGTGYWLLGRDGGVFSFGNAPFFGSTGGMKLNAPVLSMATTPKKDGYWLLARDGGVFSFGAAGFFGSTGDKKLNSPIVGMVPTPSGQGYWLYAEDGGVFTFGDAPFEGTPASESPNSPIVAMLATRDGRGYWLVTKTGKVYAYGTARAMAGVDDIALNFPIVGMAASPSGDGLWLVAADGGIFALGDVAFHGSAGAIRLNQPIIGMLALADGSGYLLIASDGGVFTYGKAAFLGSTGGMTLNAPIVGIAGA